MAQSITKVSGHKLIKSTSCLPVIVPIVHSSPYQQITATSPLDVMDLIFYFATACDEPYYDPYNLVDKLVFNFIDINKNLTCYLLRRSMIEAVDPTYVWGLLKAKKESSTTRFHLMRVCAA